MAAFNTFAVTLYQQHFYKWPLKNNLNKTIIIYDLCFVFYVFHFYHFFYVYFFFFVKLLGCDKIVKNPDILLVDFFFRSVEANAATKEPSYFASIYTPEPKTYKFHYGDSFEKATIKSPRDEQRQRSSPTNPATDRI